MKNIGSVSKLARSPRWRGAIRKEIVVGLIFLCGMPLHAAADECATTSYITACAGDVLTKCTAYGEVLWVRGSLCPMPYLPESTKTVPNQRAACDAGRLLAASDVENFECAPRCPSAPRYEFMFGGQYGEHCCSIALTKDCHRRKARTRGPKW